MSGSLRIACCAYSLTAVSNPTVHPSQKNGRPSGRPHKTLHSGKPYSAALVALGVSAAATPIWR